MPGKVLSSNGVQQLKALHWWSHLGGFSALIISDFDSFRKLILKKKIFIVKFDYKRLREMIRTRSEEFEIWKFNRAFLKMYPVQDELNKCL